MFIRKIVSAIALTAMLGACAVSAVKSPAANPGKFTGTIDDATRSFM